MKTVKLIFILMAILVGPMVKGQETGLTNYWQIGFGLGELPIEGSLKPSITVGYYFNKKIYAGVIYQCKDKIRRDESSFNAKSSELTGLLKASEAVAQRFLFQLRYTPIKNGPYLSGGFVFNGRDTETMIFDDRPRQLLEQNYDGSIEIQQARPAGWGLALGLGYQYQFSNGFSTGFEWTPAWGQYPAPSYSFGGSSPLSAVASDQLRIKMNEGFKSSITNMYKVFHIGVAYRFQ